MESTEGGKAGKKKEQQQKERRKEGRAEVGEEER